MSFTRRIVVFASVLSAACAPAPRKSAPAPKRARARKPPPPPPPKNHCVICQKQSHFLPYGRVTRPRASCPVCLSLERHRLLFLYLKHRTGFFRKKLAVLHFAANPGLEQIFRKLPNLKYVTADLFVKADLKLDIADTKLPASSYDVVLAYHVLEHVTEDRKAMREVYRILKPGGFAIMQVPISLGRPETYENPKITTPEGREKHFGQRDHVRLYGWKDYQRRLEGVGFEVTLDKYVLSMAPAVTRRRGLERTEYLYVARKPRTEKR